MFSYRRVIPSTPAYLDDRGREHLTLVQAPGPKPRDAFDAARLPDSTRVVGYGCLVMLVPVAVFLLLVMLASAEPTFALLVAIVIGVSGILYFVSRHTSSTSSIAPAKASDRNHLGAWLLRGSCPPCGYSLYGLKPHADGCIQCPECGSAWNLAAWARALPPFDPTPFTIEQTDGWMLLQDDRGRRCVIRPEACTDVEADTTRSRRHRIFLAALTLSGAVWVLLWWLLGSITAPSALALLALSVPILIHVVRDSSTRSRWIEASLARRLAARICPRCDAALDPQPAISDGTRLCRRCGAAWRLN
jgi:hypothetical protein